LGIVPVSGRGSLPFALVHGEPLIAAASLALQRAGVELVDFNVPWEELRSSGRPVVLHDPLCPLTPPGFVVEAVEAAVGGEVVVGVRPVTDTLKQLDGGLVGGTVDRDAHVVVTSPVVLPGEVVAALPEAPDLGDFALLVQRLRASHAVRLLEAPPLARRVAQESDLALLEALSAGTSKSA
jgi:2-C-methyl-D-erythritol 4-phosphate cytidylyltransferase